MRKLLAAWRRRRLAHRDQVLVASAPRVEPDDGYDGYFEMLREKTGGLWK